MNLTREPIHRWDGPTFFKAVVLGAVLEAIAIAPALLSPWGHAGPESLWGWLGLLLNLPGMVVIGILRTITNAKSDMLVGDAIMYTYLIQTLILSYIAFFCMRWKKRRRVESS